MAAPVSAGKKNLPFPDSSVRAIFLTHVFHHIPDVGLFFEEASRVLVPGGVISMVDETHTPFAKFFFSKVHPEPYDDQAPGWTFTQSDSMLDSNQALTWIVFSNETYEIEAYPLKHSVDVYGYRIKERLLRPPIVRVASNSQK